MLKDYYKQAAIIFFNTLLFIIIINLLLYAFYAYKDGNRQIQENQITLKYGKKAVVKAYPHLSYPAINQLLTETWNRPLDYDFYTGFKEKSFRGQFVNVHPAGFRRVKNQGTWPIDTTKYNIFIFGGSTTFGYGVADYETIPAYLQDQLKAIRSLKKEIVVYNFGTAFYYSVQEKLLLEKLIYLNQTPDLAIFIDGLNDVGVFEEPQFAAEMQNLYQGSPGFFFRKWSSQIPLIRFINAFKRRFIKTGESANPDFCHSAHLARCFNRYVVTKSLTESVAAAKQIKTLFVWQPSPRYLYFPQDDLFGIRNEQNPDSRDCAYTYFYRHLEDLKKKGNFIWLADIQKSKKQNLYVDKVHYSKNLNYIIADTLTSYLSQNIWLEK